MTISTPPDPGAAVARSRPPARRPAWHRVVGATLAGGRDGRTEVDPDPTTHHTAHTAGLEELARVDARSELLDLDVTLSAIRSTRARLTEETAARTAEEAAARTAASSMPVPPPRHHPDVSEELAVIRRDRRHRQAVQDQLDVAQRARARLGVVAIDAAGLDQLVADHEKAADDRIRVRADTVQRLVCAYWRALLRAHPESPRIDAEHPVPRVSVPGVFGVITATVPSAD